MSLAAPATAIRPPVVRWSWETSDGHRPITLLAVLGVASAATMALAGLPPVDMHGPLHHLGIMDPLCGGTRSARYTLRGEWGQAWRYNPLGMLAVAGAIAMVGRALVGLTLRHWLTASVGWTPRRRRRVLLAAAAVLAALEVRQQMLAPLLTAGL